MENDDTKNRSLIMDLRVPGVMREDIDKIQLSPMVESNDGVKCEVSFSIRILFKDMTAMRKYSEAAVN